MERKHTPLGKSYWNNTGAYQKENKEISKRLIENSTTHIPTNVHGRLMSAMNMLYYDFNNNGNCNVIEEITKECPECGGSGYEDSRHSDDEDDQRDCSCCGGDCTILDELEMREDYATEFKFLLETLPREDKHLTMKLEEFILDKNIYLTRQHRTSKYDYFSAENTAIYDKTVDAVIYFILTTENKEL